MHGGTSDGMEGKREKVTRYWFRQIAREEQKKPSHPISDMYAEEKLLLVTFTDGNHKIDRVTKETHKLLAYTSREPDARASKSIKQTNTGLVCGHHKSPGIMVNQRPEGRSCSAWVWRWVNWDVQLCLAALEQELEETFPALWKLLVKPGRIPGRPRKIFSRVCRSSEQ